MTEIIDTEMKSEAAKASSAQSRINIPLNLENWRSLPDDQQKQLIWFHQYLLDNKMSYDDAREAVGYDNSTIFRLLKGTYTGSFQKVCKAIAGYKKITDQRGSIKLAEFVQNSITNMIWSGLDYALANNSITTIIGESRMGKTTAATMWRDCNNHGTSVYIVAPPIGGTKMFLRRIAETVGVNKNLPVMQMYDSITRSFNKNRILIVDEAHRLMPLDSRSKPIHLEVLRDLHDQTNCGLALIATQRFDDDLRKSHYQYEQILGRIGMPIRLKRKILKGDILPIIAQYIPKPTQELIETCFSIANSMGRLGIMVEILKVASRIASKRKENLKEEHIFSAIGLRQKMMGEHQYAKA